MNDIKDSPLVKRVINIEKYLYFSLLNKKLENESKKRKMGWIDPKYTPLKSLKGRYQGERCFVIGMGPSLTQDDLDSIKNEYTFGMNSLALNFKDDPWRPDFYGIQDVYVYPKIRDALLEEDRKGNTKTIFFVGSTICDKFKVSDKWIKYPLNAAYHKYGARINKYFAKASDDCYVTVYDGYSVTYSLIQIAIYLGFREIYLIGTDCNYEKNKKQHFIEYGYQDKNFMTVGESMIIAFAELKKLAGKMDIKIFNATRGGMLEVFPRVDIREIDLKH